MDRVKSQQASKNNHGQIVVRPGTGKRARSGIWEVARTGIGKFDMILRCHDNWTKADCERYADWRRLVDQWADDVEAGKRVQAPPAFVG